VSLASGVRQATVSGLAIDRSGFAPLLALRGAAGVAVPFAIGAAAGHLAEGAIAAAGALPAGVASFGGGFRSRANTMQITAVGMAVSTFVGGLVAGHLGPTLAALLVWGFAAGIIVVLGRDATIVGTQAVIGLAIFGRFPESVASSAVHAGWVLAGGAFQGLLAATIRPPQRYGTERRILALAYSDLADLALAPQRPSITPAAEAAKAGVLLDRRTPSEDVELLRGLADEADRVRLELPALATFAEVTAATAVRLAAAEWLREVAVALPSGTAARPEDPALARAVAQLRAQRDEAPAGRTGTPVRYTTARASALLGQLRAVDRLVSSLAGARRLVLPHTLGSPAVVMLPQRAADSARRVLTAVRDPGSPAFRHAVRLAVVLPVAEGISHLLPWQRGYWVTLTALVVLKPDYASTVQRSVARILGTGLGVVLAGLLVVAIDPAGATLTILLALATWASYTTFGASYALYSFATTVVVVLLLTPIGGHNLSTVADRGLDTLVGGAIALVGYAAWPTWERDTLARSVDTLIGALASYADVLLAAYVDPAAVDRATVLGAATSARRARVAAQASLTRATAEPARAGADVNTAAGVLAAARRIVIALHALRVTIDDATEHVAIPEVAATRVAVVAALRDLAAHRTAAVGELRAHQQELEAEADDLTSLWARRRAVVAAHLDPLVDSVDTLAHVLQP
jgi:uncharacterized membrane protein YccC